MPRSAALITALSISEIRRKSIDTLENIIAELRIENNQLKAQLAVVTWQLSEENRKQTVSFL